MTENLSQIFSKLKVLVIGDVMLDHYVEGTVSRISPEAPVPILLKDSESYFLGGAGNVFSNIFSLGGYADLISIVGLDSDGSRVLSMVDQKSSSNHILASSKRITTRKTRFIGNHFQMLRVDNEEVGNIEPEDQNWILDRFNSIIQNYHCVIIEDYNKGMLTPSLIKSLLDSAKFYNKIVLVDPKIENVNCYAGASFIKPNFLEFSKMSSGKCSIEDLNSIEIKARECISSLDLAGIFITLSDRGIVYCDREKFIHKKGYPISVSDVSGAGDTVSAMLSLCLSADLKIEKSLDFCNLAGSIACSKFGAVSVTLDDINEKMSSLRI